MVGIADVLSAQQATLASQQDALAVSQAYVPPGAGAGEPGTLPPSGISDFEVREKAPGVFLSYDPVRDGIGPNVYTRGAWVYTQKGTTTSPTIDLDVGGVRLDTKTGDADGCGGSVFVNFSKDLTRRFRGGSLPLWIQFQWMCTQSYLDTVLLDINGNRQAGVKMAIITDGDTPTAFGPSCTAIQNVITDYRNWRIPSAYNSCTGSKSHQQYSGFYDYVDKQWLVQNAVTPYCSVRDNFASCFKFVAEEWMTFQALIDLSASTHDAAAREWPNSVFGLLGARERQPSIPLIDWSPGRPKYFPMTASNANEDENGIPKGGVGHDPKTLGAEQGFGKIIFTGFASDKSRTQQHAPYSHWFRNVIFSTERVPDPL